EHTRGPDAPGLGRWRGPGVRPCRPIDPGIRPGPDDRGARLLPRLSVRRWAARWVGPDASVRRRRTGRFIETAVLVTFALISSGCRCRNRDQSTSTDRWNPASEGSDTEGCDHSPS